MSSTRLSAVSRTRLSLGLASVLFLGACGGSESQPLALTPQQTFNSNSADGAASSESAPVLDQTSLSSSLQVTTLVDETDNDATCSLREAILTVNGGVPVGGCGAVSAVISFEGSLSGTLPLGSPLPPLNSVRIRGLGEAVLTVSGEGTSSILSIPADANVIIEQLTFANGSATNGGAISNQGDLNLNSVTLSNNQASDLGGGLFNDNGRVTLRDSTIETNTADQGGGIYNLGGQISLNNSSVTQNVAVTDGGGIKSVGGRVVIDNSEISNNQAFLGAGASVEAGQLGFRNGSTLADNQSSGSAGAILADDTSQVRPIGLPAEGDVIVDEVTLTGNLPNNLAPNTPEIGVVDGDTLADPEITDGQATVIDLGNTIVSNPVQRSFTVVNLGLQPLTLAAPSLPAGFILTDPLTNTLGVGESDVFIVELEATAIGSFSGDISITNNDTDENPFTFPIEGNVMAAPMPGFSSVPAAGSTVDLGSAIIGQPTSTQTIVASESGNATLQVDAPMLSGANPGDFAISPNAAFSIVDGGSDQNIDITCTPNAVGTRTATLTYDPNEPNNSTVTYSLTCEGLPIPVPGYGSTPAPGTTIDFGNTDVGTPVSQTLTIEETGNAPLTVSSFSITGPNDTDFNVTAPSVPFTIGDGDPAVNVTIQCNPGAEGTRTATLSINQDGTNIASPVTYPLSCVGNATGIVVTNLNGSGAGSLQAALNGANSTPGIDTITFDPSLSGGIIPIGSFFPNVIESVLIQGPSGGIILDGNPIAFSANSGVTVTLDSNVQVGNGFDDPITISGGGNFTFQGPVNVEESNGAAVVDITSSGTTIFQAGLTINSSADTGLRAISGSTIEVRPNMNNTISTTTGQAVDLNGATIGANGVTFRRIDVTGAPLGVLLNNTGSAGVFSITGDGCSGVGGNSSGGRIVSTSVLNVINIGGVALDVDDGFLLVGNVRAALSCVLIEAAAGGGGGADNGIEAIANGSRIDLQVSNSTFQAQDVTAGASEVTLEPRSGGQIFAQISNSTFPNFPTSAISTRPQAGEIDLTLTNNQFAYGNPSLGPTDFSSRSLAAVVIQPENPSAQICLDLSGNSVTSGQPQIAFGINDDFAFQNDSGSALSIDVSGLSPSPANQSQISSFINSNNDPSASFGFILGRPAVTGSSSACTLPNI